MTVVIYISHWIHDCIRLTGYRKEKVSSVIWREEGAGTISYKRHGRKAQGGESGENPELSRNCMGSFAIAVLSQRNGKAMN